MRWWRMFCLLILIASPLALNANAQSPSPRPSVQREAQLADSRQQQSNPAQAQAVKRSAPAVTKPAKPAIQATVRNESSGIVEKQGDDKKSNPSQSVLVWSWSMIQTALQILFTFVTTVATVYVAKFTYRLVQVTKDLHIATEAATNASIKSATAAEKSVEVAERALAAQRPFLNIEKSYYRKLWIRCGNGKGGVPFRVDHANPGGSRVEGDATDVEGSGKDPCWGRERREVLQL